MHYISVIENAVLAFKKGDIGAIEAIDDIKGYLDVMDDSGDERTIVEDLTKYLRNPKNRRLPGSTRQKHPLDMLLGPDEAAQNLKFHRHRMWSVTLMRRCLTQLPIRIQLPMQCVSRVKTIQSASGLIPSAMSVTRTTPIRLDNCVLASLEAVARSLAGYLKLPRCWALHLPVASMKSDCWMTWQLGDGLEETEQPGAACVR